MPKPISNDKRKAIVKYMEEGESKTKIASLLGIDVQTVTRVWEKYQSTGDYTPRQKKSGRKPKISEEQMQEVFEKIKEQPTITLAALIETLNLPIKKSALSTRLINAGFILKKATASEDGTTKRRYRGRRNI